MADTSGSSELMTERPINETSKIAVLLNRFMSNIHHIVLNDDARIAGALINALPDDAEALDPD